MPESKNIPDEKILELYRIGLTNKEIADSLQVTQPAINYRLERLGLINNCHANRVNPDSNQVCILHSMGLTNIGIAYLLHVPVECVNKCITKLELKDNSFEIKRLLEEPVETAIAEFCSREPPQAVVC